LPVFVKDLEEFKKYAEKAVECRVVRDRKKNVGKIKARTKRYLYTLVVPLDKLDDIIKSIKCSNMVEISKGAEGEKE
jgi:methyl coenzyme M reductase subunit C